MVQKQVKVIGMHQVTCIDSHNNGELRARGSLKDGDMDSKWSFYYDNGNPNYNVVFKDGSPIHLEFFTIDGKLLWEKKL